MTFTEPAVNMSARYPIGAASKILDIDRKTLLNHTKEGKIRCGFFRCNGRRFFTGSEILRYWKSHF